MPSNRPVPRHPLALLRLFPTLLALLAVLGLGACQNGASAPIRADASESSSPVSRAVVVTVVSDLRVDDVESAIASVRELTTRHHGVVANARVQGNDVDASASFELRVPSDRAEPFRAELRKLGDTDHESESIEDVTAPLADLDARLRNARAHEKRLLALLEDRSSSLADVVAVEKELASVRETVERLEAEKRVIDTRVAFTTIQLSLRPKHVRVWDNPLASIASAFGGGLRFARTLVVGTAVVTAAALPSVIVIALVALAFWGILRGLLRWRARRTLAARRG